MQHRLIHKTSELELGTFDAAGFEVPSVLIESHHWSGSNSLKQPVAISQMQLYLQLSGLHVTKPVSHSQYSAVSTAGTYVLNPADYARYSQWKDSRFCILTFDPEIENSFLFPGFVQQLKFDRGSDPYLFRLGLLLNDCMKEEGNCQFRGQSIVHAIFVRISEIQKIHTCEKFIGKRNIAAIVDYLNEKAIHEINLPEISNFVGCTTHHLVKSFKAATGYSPYHYVLEQRIRLAMQLLVHKKIPIESIGLDCGFNSNSQFSRIFRSHLGMSPMEFRRRS